MITGIAVAGSVFAQDKPLIDYWPWEQKPGMAQTTPMKVTPTPSDEEAKKLPKVTPPVIPTVQVIDLAPNIEWDAKLEIGIQRAKGGEWFVIKVPSNLKSDEIEQAIKPFLDVGDEIFAAVPTNLGGPIPDAPSSAPNDK